MTCSSKLGQQCRLMKSEQCVMKRVSPAAAELILLSVSALVPPSLCTVAGLMNESLSMHPLTVDGVTSSL